MSKIYRQLRQNPPTLNVKDGAREVIVNLISVMCDNRKKVSFKKGADGDFVLRTHGDAFSNFQMKCDVDDLTWAADEGNWAEVFDLINTGTVAIHDVKSR